MSDRAHRALISAIIFCTIAAGSARLPWWTAIAAAALLTGFAQRYRAVAPDRVRASAIFDGEAIYMVAAVLNGAVISTAAFSFGRLSGWFWGI